MKKIIIAPNSFKDSLNASEAAKAIKQGFKNSKLNGRFVTCPIGDGGDGTGQLLHRVLKGGWVSRQVAGPLGRTVKAGFSLVDNGETAIIEMAEASGLNKIELKDRDPLKATSY